MAPTLNDKQAAMQLICTHLNADFDGLASMVAASKIYPEAVLVFPGSQERNVRRYLSQDLPFQKKLRKIKDLDLSQVTGLVVVDTSNSRRLGPLAACLKNPDLTLQIYDHHPNSSGDLYHNDETVLDYGATTTLLVDLLQRQGHTISADEATLFALGIYEDTGSLTHLTTTAEDLRAAAWLVEQGARLDEMAQFLSHELTSTEISILHNLIETAQKYTIQDIPLILLTQTYEEYIDEFALIVRRFMAMENLDVLFALVSMAGRIYLIARSRIADVNVGAVAREFGGGGHATAASATLKDMTLIDAQEKLVHILHRHIRPQPVAGQMMSKPAITVRPNNTIDDAKEILTRYNITAAPVCEDIGRAGEDGALILGIITRQILEKANHHNLGKRPVTDYMSSDVSTLPLAATLADIQDLIIESRQRIVPIVDDCRLVGVITRTDLLNRLVNDPAHLPKNLLHEEESPHIERTRNLSSVIAEFLPREMILLLRSVGEVAQKNGYNAYAVGGFVRDLLLRQKNDDLDIVVEGDGMAFAKALARELGGRYRIHERFKTGVVLLDNDFKLDVATARLEYYEYPAAMPTVELSSIKLDLSRRDFTINAMAIHLNPANFGTLIDFFNCQSDLKKRQIKVLHNLSFVEDPSRIFRAIRFEKRMDFQISPHTRRLVNNAVKMNLFGKADDPRFLTELKYILGETTPLPALQRLAEFDLLQFLWPDLKPHSRIDRRYGHILTEVQLTLSWHRMLYLEESCRSWMVYILAIMSRSSDQILVSFCGRYHETDKNTEFLLAQKRLCHVAIGFLRRHRELKKSEIVDCLAEIEIEGLLYMMAIARKPHVKKALSLYITTLRYVTAELGGKDLIKLGYRPGPKFTEILTRLKIGRLNGTIESKDDETALVLREFPL